MTKEDAIKTLKELWRETNDTWYEEVYKMAINALEADRKTEPKTDCNKLINEVVKLDMSREDKFKVMELLERHCEKCKHYLFTDVDGYYCEHETYGQPCGYKPKDELQTYITEDRTQTLDRWQTYHRNTTSAVTPCSNCQEFDCYGCEYKQTERSNE